MGTVEQMGSSNGENNEAQSRMVDDLYILKSSLVLGKKLTKEAPDHLKQILAILEECPELSASLLKWKFLENEVLYCLRSRLFNISLKIIIIIISHCKLAPELYFSKKFLFFITERLYFSLTDGMEGECFPEASIPGDDPVSNRPGAVSTKDVPHNINNGVRSNNLQLENGIKSTRIGPDSTEWDVKDVSEIFRFDHTGAAANPMVAGICSSYTPSFSCREIMIFVKMLIEIHKQVVSILFDIGFFDLSNVIITTETARMFNAVFEGITYTSKLCDKAGKRAWQQDGLYEIQRKLFDPEIFFRSKDIFVPKKHVQRFKGGVFHEIYKQCTSIRDFADLGVRDFIDAMLYKRIVYMSDDLDILLLEGKDPKVLRFYRRSLEEGGVPDKSYLNGLIKALDDKKLSREACVSLYYFIDLMTDLRLFTEDRVRRVFEGLEYVCEHECMGESDDKGCLQSKDASDDAAMRAQASTSFDSDLHSGEIFGDGTNGSLFETPCDINWAGRQPNGIGDGHGGLSGASQSSLCMSTNGNLNRCERLRIVKLLKFLYSSVEKKVFYKPTHMILLRSVYAHCSDERSFIDTYFRDFVDYLNSGPKKVAECLLPVRSLNKPPKMIKLVLSDDLDMHSNGGAFGNAGASVHLNGKEDYELGASERIESHDTSMTEMVHDKSTVRIVGGRIESDVEN